MAPTPLSAATGMLIRCYLLPGTVEQQQPGPLFIRTALSPPETSAPDGPALGHQLSQSGSRLHNVHIDLRV